MQALVFFRIFSPSHSPSLSKRMALSWERQSYHLQCGILRTKKRDLGIEPSCSQPEQRQHQQGEPQQEEQQQPLMTAIPC